MTAIAEPEERVKSTHKAEIVPIEMTKHPDADSLSVIPVYGFNYVGRTSDWLGVKKGAWIPPDSTVSVCRPEFAFLAEQAKSDGRARIKAKRLRGIVSYGLMVPVPDETPLGEDWAERLGVEHYEPAIAAEKGEKFFMGGEVASGPDVYTIKYDVDAFLRYHHLFEPGEPVNCTEKADGANFKTVYHDGKMFCSSRTEWKKEYPDYSHLTVEALIERGMDKDKAEEVIERLKSKPKKKNLWWEALERTPELEKFCRDNPDTVVYSEVVGNVNCIKYGFEDGKNRVAVFDIMKDGRFLDVEEAREIGKDLPWVPLLTNTLTIPYDFETIKSLAEGPTLMKGAKSGVIREGCVIKTLKERREPRVGRLCFKIVNPVYLERYR